MMLQNLTGWMRRGIIENPTTRPFYHSVMRSRQSLTRGEIEGGISQRLLLVIWIYLLYQSANGFSVLGTEDIQKP
ncbi:uncharacterized protein EAE98_005171 [Botrytis deweyae]|uniref:Uncharacterized protein n=1 Tax=Botrytis deweyae TaxID=2478750 RepID=A0ABQ7IN35_9HELO|nr:uncharacterized protein EAE98_005171 [Botrytis deweyae]KAF7929252.1 hypothetical protein EAE98_005171 [Botrytis deweyae]